MVKPVFYIYAAAVCWPRAQLSLVHGKSERDFATIMLTGGWLGKLPLRSGTLVDAGAELILVGSGENLRRAVTVFPPTRCWNSI
jgi:hypothetical protein